MMSTTKVLLFFFIFLISCVVPEKAIKNRNSSVVGLSAFEAFMMGIIEGLMEDWACDPTK